MKSGEEFDWNRVSFILEAALINFCCPDLPIVLQ